MTFNSNSKTNSWIKLKGYNGNKFKFIQKKISSMFEKEFINKNNRNI